MTTHQKLTIAENEVEIENCMVVKTLGEVNSSSKFSATLNNYTGRYTGSYSIGDEVKIYCDKDINPPTTQIFLGILENLNLQGKQQGEQLVISGRDYAARLIDRTVEPEVYNNLPAGSIVKDIIDKYARGDMGKGFRGVWPLFIPKGFTLKDLTDIKRKAYIWFYFNPMWWIRRIRVWFILPGKFKDDLKLFKIAFHVFRTGGTKGQLS